MEKMKQLILLLFYICSNSIFAQQKIDNPVLPRIADAGVMKFNGRYYIGGVFTEGDFYVSNDLVKWDGPVHVFSMNNKWATKYGVKNDQIHANDIHYINGTFHMYWSVNYWSGERNIIHIAHATSEKPLGPYDEPVKDTWLDNRIDPHLFIDDNGKMYMYMVKFTDGNTIWTRPMKDPYTFEGEPKYIFASQTGNWETLDNRVEEGPWVIKYRDRYYLMYNCNHTSTQWGNYALGVAESAGPLEFNHGNKYPYPVVKSNQIDLEELFVDLLKYSDNGEFLYSSEAVSDDWYKPGFNTTSWQKGKPGFGFPVTENSTTKKVRTIWKDEQCHLRKDFSYNKDKNGNLSMRIHHDGPAKVYLNGTLVYNKEKAGYIHVGLKDRTNLLKEGKNTLAIECGKGQWSNFLDIALFDMKDQIADDILYTPGQPNILRGPNGFEWWLVYMANKNEEPRGQYINRVNFFDKKLTVDGISGKNTPGYHPQPTKPTYQYLSGDNQPAPSVNQTIQSIPSTHYLFEAGIKPSTPNAPVSGIFAWKQDENNWLKIVIDSHTQTWSYSLKEKGKEQTSHFPLPENFRYDVFHTINVCKNYTDFMVRIDELPAPQQSIIKTNFNGKGLPGLYSEDSEAVFDGIVYTIGWDEFDDNIKGWQETGNNENLRLKGDLLNSYEFSVQLKAEKGKGIAGTYPVYIDEQTNLKVSFDFSKQLLILSGKNKGKTTVAETIPLRGLKDHYANMTFSDFMERHFIFDAPTILDAILFKKEAIHRSDTIIENIHEQFNIYFMKNDQWEKLANFHPVEWEHPGLSRIEFPPIETTELIFVNKVAENENFVMRDFSLQKIWVNEIFKTDYNLQIVKNKEHILLFIDGKQIYQLPNNYGPSQIGLFYSQMKAVFNGIMLYHLPD